MILIRGWGRSKIFLFRFGLNRNCPPLAKLLEKERLSRIVQ